jgi:hypothetical protein
MTVHDSDAGAAETYLDGLSDEEFIAALTTQLWRRERFHAVRENWTVLVSIAPTLADAQHSRIAAAARSAEVFAARSAILGAAKSSVLERPMLDSTQVSRALGQSPKSRNAASRLASSGAVVALPVGGKKLFPAFQFDVEHHRVRPIVEEINSLLDARTDPWGVASWWLSKTGYEDDPRSPADLAVEGGSEEWLRDMAADLVED